MAQRTKDSVVNITHKGQYSRMNTFFSCYFFFFSCSAGYQTQSLTQARELLCHRATSQALEKHGFLFMDSRSGFQRCCSPVPHICEVSGYLYHLHQRVQVLVNASLVKACLKQGGACTRVKECYCMWGYMCLSLWLYKNVCRFETEEEKK